MIAKFIWLFCRVVAFMFQFVGFSIFLLSLMVFIWWMAGKL